MPEEASGQSTEKARQQTQRIEEQLTQAEWDELCTFAKRRCASLRNIGVRLDSGSPEDLVAGAVTDTATGRLTWPEHKTLTQHIRDTVLSRTSHEMKRQRRVRFVSLDKLSPESPRLVSQQSTHRIVEARRAVVAVVSKLAVCSRGDSITLSILACQLTGVVGRKETAELMNISVEDYDRAQHRIRRRLAKLQREEGDT